MIFKIYFRKYEQNLQVDLRMGFTVQKPGTLTPEI